MGKSKSGKQGPPYKEPPEKHIVITTPWTINVEGISAWLGHMVKETYPDARLNVIYSRSKKIESDDTLIVQFPREVQDVSFLLGAHFHSAFLTDRPRDPKVSYIYEYDYRNQGDPSVKWHDHYTNNDPIPDPRFPIKDPYPPSVLELAPVPMGMPIARRISPAVMQRVAAARNAVMVAPAPGNGIIPSASNPSYNAQSSIPTSCSSPFNAGADKDPEVVVRKFLPPPRKSMEVIADPRLAYRTKDSVSGDQHDKAQPVEAKKMDPYEEAELAEKHLRSVAPVKKDEAEEFLGSLFDSVTVKEEEKPSIVCEEEIFGPATAEAEEDYQPSAELLAMLGTLADADDAGVDHPQAQVKPEPVDTTIPEYRPSAEFLASSNTPSTGTTRASYEPPVSVKEEQNDEPRGTLGFNNFPSQGRVKKEPLEAPILPNYALLRQPLTSSSPSAQRVAHGHQPPTRDPRIKPEPVEHAIDPRTYQGNMKIGPSRDPRVRPSYSASSSIPPSKRAGDHLQDRGHLYQAPKRVKTEYE